MTVTVEPTRTGWAVIITNPGRLPARVATFAARYQAEAHAAHLRGES